MLAAGEQGLRYYCATGDQVGVSQPQHDKLLHDSVWEEVDLAVQAGVQNNGVCFSHSRREFGRACLRLFRGTR